MLFSPSKEPSIGAMGQRKEVYIREIVSPISFWVTPVRGLKPCSPMVSSVIEAERKLKDLSQKGHHRVSKNNFEEVKAGIMVGVTVSCISKAKLLNC